MMISRRRLVSGIGAALLAPVAAEVQQRSPIPRIGFLAPGTKNSYERYLQAFLAGMGALGYIEGRTMAIEYRYAEGRLDQLQALAIELVNLRVDVIVVGSTAGALAAKTATRTIPIVSTTSSDPVGAGVVASLARPGGNVTGLSLMASDLSAKRLDLLREAVPKLTRVALIWDSSNPGMALRVHETQLASRQTQTAFRELGATNLSQLEAAFADLIQQRPDALLVTTEPFTRQHRERILEFSMRNRIPTMYEERGFVDEGGLMSYGPSVAENFRQAAMYVDRILKGAKPGDLPVEQPTKFELVINLKTAKALGLTIPPSLLLRADHIIDP